MENLKLFCIRCPDDESAILCSSRVDKPATLAKCKASTNESLWRGFTDDPNTDPSTLFSSPEECNAFLVQTQNTISTFLTGNKKSNPDFDTQQEKLKQEKAHFTYDFGGKTVPVITQMLEYAFSQAFAGTSPAKGNAKGKVNKSTAVSKAPSVSTSGSATLPSTSTSAGPKTLPAMTDSMKALQISRSVSTDQSSAADTEIVLDEATSVDNGMSGFKTPTSNPPQVAGSSHQASPEFGHHLKSNTTKSQFGSTSPSKIGVQPSWKLEQLSQQPKKEIPPISNQIASKQNALSDTIDTDRTGKGGRPIQVITNYLQVKAVPKHVFEYSLSYGRFSHETGMDGIQREVTQRSQKEQIWKTLRDMDPFYGNDDWATDYNTVWSLKPLKNPSQLSAAVREPVTGEYFTTQRVDFHKFSGKPSSITGVKITFTRKLSFPDESSSFVSSGEVDAKGAPVHITALNALLSSKVATSKQVISTGPNKFYAKNDHSSFLGVQAHRGYFTSIRPGTQNILLNFATTTGTFYQSIKVSDFMHQTSLGNLSEYGNPLSARYEKLLVGRSVQILYSRASHDINYDANVDANRHRVIVEIGKVPSQQMFGEGANRMSVKDYFVKKLGANPPPSDKFLCVNVGAKSRRDYFKSSPSKTRGNDSKAKQIWIPAEYLALDPDQPFARRLAAPHMEELHKVSLLPPAATQDKIVKNGFNLFGLFGNNFTRLGIQIVPELLLIPARALGDPQLLYRAQGTGNKTKTIQPRDASWNIATVNLLNPAVVHTSISALDFRSEMTGGPQEGLALAMTNALKAAGLNAPTPAAATATSGHGLPYWWSGNFQKSHGPLAKDFSDRELAHIGEGLKPARGPALHVVVLQDNDSDSYATIKRVFDTYVGSHTVCLTAAKIPRPNDARGAQLFGNLALKFNLKLGGINHLPVFEKQTPALTMLGKDTMVVGADVSHAPSQMRFCPSVAALVASDDSNYANFPGSMRLQASKQEFLQDIKGMMIERLLRYGSKNKRLPKKIVFFRDGVGEDMYDRVRDEEITQIHSAYEYIRSNAGTLTQSTRLPVDFKSSDQKLDLTFIIVGKRHNTRFFCKSPADADKNGNVKAGLLVDRVIARPKLSKDDKTFDFFLQSHQALKGTARSGHYVVLQRGAFNVSEIQKFTHAFCFNYARATKGVSYAGPAYYADRLAERGTLYLKAYTKNKSAPAIQMTQKEMEDPNKREGEKKYERRVAQHIQDSVEWNPRVNVANPANGRVNPWHPWMDPSMFWL